MFVKICGLTNLEDTLAAAAAGAHAVGFNFVTSSPRYIDEVTLAQWIDSVPADICKVGVFADEPVERVKAMVERLALDVVQLHGNEASSAVPTKLRVWKAVRVHPGFDSAKLDRFQTEAILLDGPASGIPFDWSAIRANGHKVILAGGLHSGNVCAAIRQVQPWGVDVCSRVEIAPGRKDHHLMKEFIQTALSC